MSSTSIRQRTLRVGGQAAGAQTPKTILARLDRIGVWSMPFMFIGIIGTGFLFAFYDVFDINVSFIQSCVALKHGCTPANAVTTLRVPVVLNLAGYVIGALALAPISDRIGRRNMLLFTMLLTGLGSLYNALAPDYTQFVLARVITGIGVGADLAIVNTYIGEVAPRRNRARWISVIFIMSSLGALLGIWLGLFLTTTPAPWPHGISFAQAGPGFTDGWRWMYAVGALLAAIGVLLRLELPESARWLVGRGRIAEADKVVSDMEVVAAKHGPLAPVSEDIPVDETVPESSLAFRALFANRTYVRRVIVLLAVWFLAYVTVFGFSAGFTSMLVALKYPPPEAGLITAVGAFGFLACALFAVAFADRLERKHWLPIGAADHGDRRRDRRRGRDERSRDRLHRGGDRVLRLQHLGADDLRALDRELPDAGPSDRVRHGRRRRPPRWRYRRAPDRSPDSQYDRARGDADYLRLPRPRGDRRPVQPQHARSVLRRGFALTDTG